MTRQQIIALFGAPDVRTAPDRIEADIGKEGKAVLESWTGSVPVDSILLYYWHEPFEEWVYVVGGIPCVGTEKMYIGPVSAIYGFSDGRLVWHIPHFRRNDERNAQE